MQCGNVVVGWQLVATRYVMPIRDNLTTTKIIPERFSWIGNGWNGINFLECFGD